MLDKLLTYCPILVYLLLFSYVCSFSKSPIVQSIHWVAHTATVVNANLATFDNSSGHHHQQEIAIQQLEQLQNIGQEQPDEEQSADVEAPKKKVQVRPILANFVLSPSQVTQHQFRYCCPSLTPFSTIHSPPPELL